MRLELKVAQYLTKESHTIAIAESCTGGLLTHTLTNIPGSSRYLVLGIVAYADAAKKKLLGIPSKTLLTEGAVSAPVAAAMAQGIQRLAKTDIGIGITGIAGPSGATPQKPLGLTYIALSRAQKVSCHRYLFKGSRLQIKKQAVQKALHLLLNLAQE